MKATSLPTQILRIVCIMSSMLFNHALSSQTVSVNLIKDDPDHLPAGSFVIDPLYSESWKPNGSAGMYIEPMFHAGKAVDFYIPMQLAYAESKVKAKDNPDNLPVFHDLGFVFGLNFANSYQIRSTKVRYQSYGSQSYSYIYEDLKHRTCLALRGGVDFMGSAYDYTYFNTQYISNTYHDTVSLTSGKSNYDQFSYVVGFSLKNIYGGVVSIDGSTRKVGKWSEFYFDGLIGSKTIYDEELKIYSDSGTVFFPKIQKVGYKLGWRLQDPVRSSVHLGLEFGCYPGPALPKQTHYFLVRFGFTLTDNKKYCDN